MNSKIGNEIGMIHEMMITGRKANVGNEFFTIFAQNVNWFDRINLLSLQFAAMKLSPGEKPKAVGVESALPLIEKVKIILESCGGAQCIDCGWGSRRSAVHLYVPEEILQADRKHIDLIPNPEQREQTEADKFMGYQHHFHDMLSSELLGIGIQPAELAVNYDGLDYRNGKLEGGCCSGHREFEAGLRKTIANHNLICEMMK